MEPDFARCWLRDMLTFAAATVGQLSPPLCVRGSSEAAGRLWGPLASPPYDKHERPKVALALQGLSLVEGAPAPSVGIAPEAVSVQIQIFSVNEVVQTNEQVVVDAWIREVWTDHRFAFNASCVVDHLADPGYVVFSGKPSDAIWSPELLVENIVDSETVIESGWWVRSDGLVWWTRKVIWKLRCPMDFSAMPFDTQICPVRISSLKYNGQKVSLSFFEPSSGGAVKFTCGAVKGSQEWTLHPCGGSRARCKRKWQYRISIAARFPHRAASQLAILHSQRGCLRLGHRHHLMGFLLRLS